jgi:hypothetical protein
MKNVSKKLLSRKKKSKINLKNSKVQIGFITKISFKTKKLLKATRKIFDKAKYSQFLIRY